MVSKRVALKAGFTLVREESSNIQMEKEKSDSIGFFLEICDTYFGIIFFYFSFFKDYHEMR